MHSVISAHPDYLKIWFWLLGLAIGSVLIGLLPLPHQLTTVLIFAAATVKALLVALYYMHLRFEHLLIYGLVIFPLLLLAILLFVLFPDITFHT